MSASKTLSQLCRPAQQAVKVSRQCQRQFSVAGLERALPRSASSIPSSNRFTRPSRVPRASATHLQVRHESSSASPAPTFYTDTNLGRTALYDLHLEHGAKMVPFGNYSMPVQYSDLSVGDSHHWTRTHASLFDVGHMVQYHVDGPGAEAFLESLTPAGLADMKPGQSSLSALLHPRSGGIVDDCIVTRLEPGPNHLFYLVTNAGCRDKDYAFLKAALAEWDANHKPAVSLRNLQTEDGEQWGLVALQGPLAAEILRGALADACKVDVNDWYFGNAKYVTLALPQGESLPIVASRGGYTGEDGFELSIHPSQTVDVVRSLMGSAGPEKLRLAGLGARDSLRLEAGMCLYGHDIDDSTTPVEAGLSWIVPKARREAGGFNGAETILPQLVPVSKGGKGVSRRRVGLIVEGAPAREGAEIVDAEGSVVGKITSGCPSPTLKKNITMGYVKDGLHKSGTELEVVVRGKKRKAVVSKMPFVPSKYFKER